MIKIVVCSRSWQEQLLKRTDQQEMIVSKLEYDKKQIEGLIDKIVERTMRMEVSS